MDTGCKDKILPEQFLLGTTFHFKLQFLVVSLSDLLSLAVGTAGLSSHMAPRATLLLLCALSAGLQLVASSGTRKLQQSNGPANTYGNAASATTADLINDPAGRAHLLVSICECVTPCL